jgi:hypothetical protein
MIMVCIITPAVAATDNERYGYITVDAVDIRLDNDSAVIHVNYSVDEGTRFIFFLLGKQDLQTKLLKILNYDEADMKSIDLTDADFVVPNAATALGKGVFWYPSHEFNVVIPNLTIESPQVTRNYANTNLFPEGMGYFGTNITMTSDYRVFPETLAPVDADDISGSDTE